MRRLLEFVAVAAALLLAWQFVVWATAAPAFILPPPARVASILIERRELIAHHALVTAWEVLIGLAIGAILGFVTALLLMLSPLASRLFTPVMLVSQAVPVFALAPLLTLWLGFGVASKVAAAILIIYFPVAATFLDGLRRTEPGLLDLAAVMGAGRVRALFLIRLPAALPAFGSGLQLGAVYAPIGAVIGEWVGASGGLGYLMLMANGRAQTDLMFAALLVLAFFTVTLHAAAALLARTLADRAGGRRGPRTGP